MRRGVPGATIAAAAPSGTVHPATSDGISTHATFAATPSSRATASATSAPRKAGRNAGVPSGAGAR